MICCDYFHYSSRINLILISSLRAHLQFRKNNVFWDNSLETISRIDEILRAVISNLFDIPLPANHRVDSSWVHVHVFLKTRLQLLTTMDESRTQGRMLFICPSINVFHARKIKTNDTECRQRCTVVPRSSSARLSLIRR